MCDLKIIRKIFTLPKGNKYISEEHIVINCDTCRHKYFMVKEIEKKSRLQTASTEAC